MRRATLIIALAALAGALIAGAALVDASRRDTLADGARIAGIPVGGLETDVARRRLATRLLPRLDHPVVVRRGERRFVLTATRARVGVDVAGLVDEALRRSRTGSLAERSWRMVTGAKPEVDVPLRVTLDRRAIGRFVRRVRAAVTRPTRDASVSFDAQRPRIAPARSGRRLLTARLRRAIERALRSPRRDAPVVARTRAVPPGVSTADLADRYPVALIVDRAGFRLRVFERLEPAGTYPIAVGQVGYDTPTGLYRVTNKAIDPAWSVPNKPWAGKLAGKVIPGGVPENPIKSRWLGLVDGVGIHGTDDEASIGSRASHGCIRMRISDVKRLYDRVPVGSAVYIA